MVNASWLDIETHYQVACVYSMVYTVYTIFCCRVSIARFIKHGSHNAIWDAVCECGLTSTNSY
jgi:hypothetical protein